MKDRRCDRLYGIGSLLLALGLAAISSVAEAEPYPSRPIRIVVPTAVSTPPDIIGRVIANELSGSENWSVIVENRPGALMTLGGSDVLKQPADGYSLFAMALPVTAAPALMPNISFSLGQDFAPVVKASVSYNVLVVNPSVPAKSVSDLVALLKGQPDQLTFSSTGFGTPAHLIGEMFKLQAGVRATHVPYQQMPQAIGDLVAGTNQYQFIAMLPVVDLIKTGKLRALAVTGPRRVPALPEVPTIIEAGFPGLEVEDWVGFSVKAGTPNEIIARLNAAINKALTKPNVGEMLARLGAQPAGGTPSEYGDLVRSQIALWGKVIKETDIKIQQ
jgi:tripartite-type tricarboxylate transporter receptor subunit TctC